MAPSTTILTDASRQLFTRAPDERFTSLLAGMLEPLTMQRVAAALAPIVADVGNR